MSKERMTLKQLKEKAEEDKWLKLAEDMNNKGNIVLVYQIEDHIYLYTF
jgi:hypothetical protein